MDTLSPSPVKGQPSRKVEAGFPQALDFLFRPKRYKVAYGGRGGAKSWGAARALLILGMQRPLRILCARELQNSIAESVHKLLSDQIALMNLPYKIEKTQIYNDLGTGFFFEGIYRNVDRIKSYEGVDICWVEEAHRVTKASWEILIPTIRKDGSEIWVTFNPDLESDETYQRFIKSPPPEDMAFVRKITWRNNPWFPQVLRDELEELKRKDYDEYLHVWEGECRILLEGAVYAEELRDLVRDGRLCKVPYDPTVGVSTFWDLGWADHTSIWFAQRVGFENHIIDHYSNHLRSLDHYLGVLQSKGYIFDTHWLPHDAKAKSLGTGKSIEELLRAKGFKTRIVPRLSLADGINAARTVFGSCWFDAERCEAGVKSLRGYHYEVVEVGGRLSKEPVHDIHSHDADAFRGLAVALKAPRAKGNDKLINAAERKPGFVFEAGRRVASNLRWLGG
jgi:phage terminase large subunit